MVAVSLRSCGHGHCFAGFSEMKLGDLVKLKSGGKTMMVASVEGDEVECVSYHDGKCVREKFPLDSLETATSFFDNAEERMRIFLEVYRDKL